MQINTDFESGSIEVVKLDSYNDIQLKLKTDNNANFSQWFHFTLESETDTKHTLKIINASESSFSSAWHGYQVLATHDQEHWFRVKTHYNDKELVITHTPNQALTTYAYFVPYSSCRQQRLVDAVIHSGLGDISHLGMTPQNRPIELLTIGNKESAKNKVWIIARQHPGETMAQWFIEGLIKQLISKDTDNLHRLAQTVFYIVPNMNPDGSFLGNHRTNQKGRNLNREWSASNQNDSPEVYYVQKKMHETGVDLFLDIHGDEEIPYSFIMSAGSQCKWGNKAKQFKRDFVLANKHFQTDVDYDTYFQKNTGCCKASNICGSTAQSTATDYVEHTFDCLALLLEMPFKGINVESEGVDYNQSQIMGLGKSILKPISNYMIKAA